MLAGIKRRLGRRPMLRRRQADVDRVNRRITDRSWRDRPSSASIAPRPAAPRAARSGRRSPRSRPPAARQRPAMRDAHKPRAEHAMRTMKTSCCEVRSQGHERQREGDEDPCFRLRTRRRMPDLDSHATLATLLVLARLVTYVRDEWANEAIRLGHGAIDLGERGPRFALEFDLDRDGASETDLGRGRRKWRRSRPRRCRWPGSSRPPRRRFGPSRACA